MRAIIDLLQQNRASGEALRLLQIIFIAGKHMAHNTVSWLRLWRLYYLHECLLYILFISVFL